MRKLALHWDVSSGKSQPHHHAFTLNLFMHKAAFEKWRLYAMLLWKISLRIGHKVTKYLRFSGASGINGLTHSCLYWQKWPWPFYGIFFIRYFYGKYLKKKCWLEPKPQLPFNIFVNFCLTLPMLRLLLAKAQECKDFWKTSKPCHVGTHWIALAEHSQMSTHLPGFQSFSRFFA